MDLGLSRLDGWSPDRRYRRAVANAAHQRLRPPATESLEVRALTALLCAIGRAEERGESLSGPVTRTPYADAFIQFKNREVGATIESLLLARCQESLVANLMRLRIELVEMYSHLFFAVTSKLDSPQVILGSAIASEEALGPPATVRRRMAMKMVAYYCGPAPFIALYSLDKRHSPAVWSQPKSFVKKVELMGRLDDVAGLLVGGGVHRTENWASSISDQVRDTLGDNFAAFPNAWGKLDYIPHFPVDGSSMLHSPYLKAK